MDYVPAHGNTNNLADRDNISGARVFDGEDQGNYSLTATLGHLMTCEPMCNLACRLWKQIQDSAVTAGGLD